MSIVPFGTAIAAISAVITASLGRDPFTNLLYGVSLLLYISLGTTMLIRWEFYAQSNDRTPRRWRSYALWGGGLGLVVLAYNFTALLLNATPIPQRWTALIFATAIVLLTAGTIVRHYMLPLTLAVQAAFRLREEDQARLIKKLTNGDHQLADEVSQALDLALNDDS